MQLFYQTFSVKGSGEFPIDMLRSDECWPTTETDSRAISQALHNRIVTLTRIKVGPTDNICEARWSSFNWQVLSEIRSVPIE